MVARFDSSSDRGNVIVQILPSQIHRSSAHAPYLFAHNTDCVLDGFALVHLRITHSQLFCTFWMRFFWFVLAEPSRDFLFAVSDQFWLLSCMIDWLIFTFSHILLNGLKFLLGDYNLYYRLISTLVDLLSQKMIDDSGPVRPLLHSAV